MRKVAVLGGGVSGIVAAWYLSKTYSVDLIENSNRLGGHTYTYYNGETPLDMGFIVLNDKNYPTLHNFFKELGVSWRFADMSFGYYCKEKDFFYSGKDVNGLFAQRKNLINPSFYKLLFEIIKIGKEGIKYLKQDSNTELSIKDFLKPFSESAKRDYFYPMCSAIWSAPEEEIKNFPALSLLTFFKNHGLLSLEDRPKWQTVVGGSSAYLEIFKKTFKGELQLSTEITSIRRIDKKFQLNTVKGEHGLYDGVIVAAPTNRIAPLISDYNQELGKILENFRYQQNRTILHTDTSLLPPKKRAWASWNFLRESQNSKDNCVCATYWCNNLQGLNVEQEYFVTLNPVIEPKKEKIKHEVNFFHPIFDSVAINAQSKLKNNVFEGLAFAGSYLGYGFHEDGARSGLEASQNLTTYLNKNYSE